MSVLSINCDIVNTIIPACEQPYWPCLDDVGCRVDGVAMRAGDDGGRVTTLLLKGERTLKRSFERQGRKRAGG